MSTHSIMSRCLVLASLALTLATPPAAVADSSPAPSQTQTDDTAPPPRPTAAEERPAPGSPDEVVCRKEEAGTGSRLGRRKVCLTRREWDEISRDSQRALRTSQDNGLKSNPTSGKRN